MCAEPKYRAINFHIETGALFGPINAVAFCYTIFPEDIVSRAQAFAVYEIENQSYDKNPGDYQASELAQVLMQSVFNKAGQRLAAGLTMLAFQYLFFKTHEAVTLYRAAQIVERALAVATKEHERPISILRWETPERKIQGVKIPKTRRSIEQAYRTYESVSHILAADLLCTNTLLASPLFERTFEVDSVLLNTAARMEQVMLERSPENFTAPWLVSPNMSEAMRDCGLIPFNGEFIAFLERGLSSASENESEDEKFSGIPENANGI